MKLKRFASLLALMLSGTAWSAVNDIFPGDFIAQPAGKTVITTFYYDRRAEGPYINGDKPARPWEGEAQVGVLRISRLFDAAGTRMAATMVISYGDQKLSGSTLPGWVNRHAAGWSDLRLNLTGWLINDPEKRRWLALNATHIHPTGDYSERNFQDIGENRRRNALTVGWVEGLGERWMLDTIAELGWYGKNRSAFPGNNEVTQDRSEALTTYLRYRWPRVHAYVGHQWNWGGETRVNGIDRNDAPNNRRAMVGLILPISADNIWNLRFSRDVAIDHGFGYTQEIAIRWINRF